MDDGLLDFCLGVYRFDCLGKSCQAAHACNQDILYPTFFLSVQDGQPELCTFILSHVHAQNVFPAIHADSYGNIDSLLYNASSVADMIMDRIQKHNGIDIIQGSLQNDRHHITHDCIHIGTVFDLYIILF